MRFSLFLVPIVVPIVFWVCYHLYKDRHLPEPPLHLLVSFLLGAGASFLALYLYQFLGWLGLRHDAFLLAETNLLGLFAYAVLAIGVIEEVSKMVPFLLVILYFREFDEPVDGIIYGSYIALGFAAVENIDYVRFVPIAEAIARGFAGPVVHMVFASIWAYYIGRAHLCERPLGPAIAGSLAFTALLHGVYDFLVISMRPQWLVIAALLIAGGWIWRLSVIEDLHSKPPGRCPPDEPRSAPDAREP
ncbi:MAG: PrsW family intramembrane metalloprotease [Xanthomonadales bacterium]|nr:PrsW family intramembrane metalloprotease [Xanthomonadales bacterium]